MKLGLSQWASCGFVFLALLTSNAVNAAPESDALEFWLAHDQSSVEEVFHEPWQGLLDTYLDADHESGVNRFNYGEVTNADHKILDEYLDSLQAQDPRKLSRDEQLAYWINFYNALTAKVVLEKYPVESIRSIRFLTSPFGPWDKNFVKVQGQSLSLNDIEHGILRPIWKDPRIHFAVNCASIGCPNLVDEAFTATTADELMDAAASDFINHPRGVDINGSILVLSSIFDWYGGDFGRDESEVVSYLSKFLEGRSVNFEEFGEIEYQYDWALNQP